MDLVYCKLPPTLQEIDKKIKRATNHFKQIWFCNSIYISAERVESKIEMTTLGSEWMLMMPRLKPQHCAMCCHGSGYLWPRLRAHSCCQVERGDGESRRPLAVLAISEKRRNVGQLCHPFEVGTACLWSGGRALGFHVVLSCDLGRPQLHKPYWIYRLKKKKKKHWHNLFQHSWSSEAWSFMK